MLNDMPGRSAASLDQSVLPELEKALRDRHDHKLIVVHLLGAHPHYRLRHPPDRAPFSGVKDSVYQQMKANGRSFWTRELRNDYDSAVHYHDSVADRTLELTRLLGGRAGWIFLSDHGQEVGSISDHAGHSASSADGYRIPLLVWGTPARGMSDELLSLPIRADWLAHSVTRWLGIQWTNYRAERDFLHPAYRWTPPPHPFRADYLS
jgi:heptose-I-phosphate ethanolaminephosphotransferase